MKNKSDLAYELFQDIQQGSLEYCYRGSFSKHTIESILSLAETNLERETDQTTIKRRVYFIMVEGLQNITRHQDVKAEVDENSGLFLIQLRDENYYITTGNVIENDKIDDLRNKLETVNSLDKKALNKYYREVLENGEISKKGGAGLGLIEMSRKSGNKLYYNFRKINDKISYFYFNTKIPSTKEMLKGGVSDLHTEEYDLKNIINFHQIINDENIIVSFKGIFDQPNMKSLLNMIEKQMGKSTVAIKVFNIIMEMLQNNVKHGKAIETNQLGNPGIFFISKTENYFTITSGNYILAENYQKLKDKIDYVNLLDYEELDHAYNLVLLNSDSATVKKTGLGLIDIRLKCESKLEYKFYETSSDYYFYTLTAKAKSNVTKNTEPLFIEATEETPEVKFDASKNVFQISKRSYPENAIGFFTSIIKWIKTYGRHPNKETNFSFEFDYVNTASSKQVMRIILELEKISKKSNVTITWRYKDIDEDMLSLGLRFQKLVDLNFEFVEIQTEL